MLAGSKIALNRHIDVAGDYANNMRLYEATGVGSLLLTDAKQNLGELFDVGREVVTYRNADELVDAIEHYLEYEDERARRHRNSRESYKKDGVVNHAVRVVQGSGPLNRV